MLFKAIEFAAKAHAGQYRKSTRIPYIVHPIAVAEILIEAGCSEEVATAGVLHDTVEDTPVTLDDLKREFGERVAELVAGASEPDKRQSWEIRKQHTLDFLQTADYDILMLICADKLHNLRSVRHDLEKHGDTVWDRFSRPIEKQRWYFESLADAFEDRICSRQHSYIFDEFRKEVKRVFS